MLHSGNNSPCKFWVACIQYNMKFQKPNLLYSQKVGCDFMKTKIKRVRSVLYCLNHRLRKSRFWNVLALWNFCMLLVCTPRYMCKCQRTIKRKLLKKTNELRRMKNTIKLNTKIIPLESSKFVLAVFMELSVIQLFFLVYKC